MTIPSTSPTTSQTAGKSPDKARTAIAVFSSILTAFTILKLLALIAAHLLVVPHFIEIFEDFDTKLPTITIILVSTSAWMWIASYALAILAMVLKETLPLFNPYVKCGISLLASILCMLIFLFYILALFLPMVQLTESLK